MNCHECGAIVETWGCVLLCDRCLCARLWRELEADDFVLLRRRGDRIWLTSRFSGGNHSTDLTHFDLDPQAESAARIARMLGGAA